MAHEEESHGSDVGLAWDAVVSQRLAEIMAGEGESVDGKGGLARVREELVARKG